MSNCEPDCRFKDSESSSFSLLFIIVKNENCTSSKHSGHFQLKVQVYFLQVANVFSNPIYLRCCDEKVNQQLALTIDSMITYTTAY